MSIAEAARRLLISPKTLLNRVRRAKAEAGAVVVESDPQWALQFGLASLCAGGSYKLASLIWRLRKRDVKASDILFKAVVAAARADAYNPDLFNVLPVVAFEGPMPSDELRGLFLGALAEGLLRVPAPAGGTFGAVPTRLHRGAAGARVPAISSRFL